MTESDWLTSNDPRAMLAYLQENGKPSDRKLRLFACACLDLRAQQKCELFSRVSEEKWQEAEIGDIIQSAAEWAESWAEGPSTDWPSPADKAALLREVFGNPFRPVVLPRTKSQVLKERATVHGCCNRHADNQGCTCLKEAPESIPWLTPTVLAIAQTIYSERRFEDMPILGDALEEAGCTDEAILQHCRGREWCNHRFPAGGYLPEQCDMCGATNWRPLRGPHCLGCWVLDTILGKE